MLGELERFVLYLLDVEEAENPALEDAIGELRSDLDALEFDPARMVPTPGGEMPYADARIEGLFRSAFPPGHDLQAAYARYVAWRFHDAAPKEALEHRFIACCSDAVRMLSAVLVQIRRVERVVEPELEEAIERAIEAVLAIRFDPWKLARTPDPARPWSDLRIDRAIASAFPSGHRYHALAARAESPPGDCCAGFEKVRRQALDLVDRVEREAPDLREKLDRLRVKIRRLAYDPSAMADGADTRIDHFFALAFPPRHAFHEINRRRLRRETEPPQRSSSPGVS